MPKVSKAWHLLPHDARGMDRLTRELNVSPIIAQLLLNRGISDASTATRFLDSPMVGLHAPGLLPGIPEAVEQLWDSIQRKEKICIYGDYDVDGVTGTSILWSLLTLLEAPVEYYIPSRLEEGYGLNSEALQTLQQKGVRTVVTVDCGITSVAQAIEAKRLGLNLIMTDHHEMRLCQLRRSTVIIPPS